jgi:stringent starvation protein B
MLTDIIGSEDHFGDMDFKLCGTRDGVTGFQLDLKLPGISLDLMTQAVYRTRDARMKVLDVMAECLASPRTELSKHAPRIETIKINPDKIGMLIGPGGKNIKAIVAETGCEINVDDDGISCTLSFSNSPHYCHLPWASVYALIGASGRGMVWPADVPKEVAGQYVVTTPTEEAKPRAALRAVEAEPSPDEQAAKADAKKKKRARKAKEARETEKAGAAP